MLIQAIGQMLPAAVAVALSPIPIIAIVLMLATPKARTNGPAFAVGWVVGLVVVMTVILFVTGSADTSSTASDSVNWFEVAIGLLFLAMALRQWRGRPAKGETAEMPAWMATVDEIEPRRALVLGLLLSAANPKNLALTASAAAKLSQAGLGEPDTVIAALVFVVIASLTVAGSVVYFLVATEKATSVLAGVKDFMAEHNAVIMMVILLLLGVKILGDGMGGLSL